MQRTTFRCNYAPRSRSVCTRVSMCGWREDLVFPSKSETRAAVGGYCRRIGGQFRTILLLPRNATYFTENPRVLASADASHMAVTSPPPTAQLSNSSPFALLFLRICDQQRLPGQDTEPRPCLRLKACRRSRYRHHQPPMARLVLAGFETLPFFGQNQHEGSVTRTVIWSCASCLRLDQPLCLGFLIPWVMAQERGAVE